MWIIMDPADSYWDWRDILDNVDNIMDITDTYCDVQDIRDNVDKLHT